MGAVAAPKVDCDQIHAGGGAVANIAEAVEFYSKRLGFTTGFLWGNPPRFAGMNLETCRCFFAKERPEPKGCFVTFVVGNADEFTSFIARGGWTSRSQSPIATTALGTIRCATCTGTTSDLAIIFTVLESRSRLSASICQCGWRSVSLACWKISRSANT